MAVFSFASTTRTSSQTKAVTQKNAPVRQTSAPAGPNPSSGTLVQGQPPLIFTDPTGPAPNATGEGVTSGAPTCAANGVDCSIYTLTLDSSVFTANGTYDPTKAYLVIQLTWNPTAYQYGSFVEDNTGTVVAQNTAGTDPETLSIPVSQLKAGTYTIVTTLEIGSPGLGYTGSVSLFQPAPAAAQQCPTCIAPRYQMYFGPDNSSGEPSMGVDWNPNFPGLQQTAPGTTAHGPTLLNTGGVSFFTANLNEYEVSFDDCGSPAIATWNNVTSTTEGVETLDPIGFTDHFFRGDIGTSYPPPHTPGRTWQTQLTGVGSLTAFTDTDGQGTTAWTQGQGGGPPTGPDHETDGAGPYAPTNATTGVVEPPHPLYANAFYYCSQNIAGDAECSRSDDGGLHFGPGVPIFQNVTQCTGGIHGHVKVAQDGSVYVPNFSCSLPTGSQGVAVSTDNGVTWVEHNVTNSGPPKSTSSVDPQVAVSLNSVGSNRPALPGQSIATPATPTIYFAYNDQDGTMKVSSSRDRGVSWSTPVDVGAAFGLVNTTFPFVVAGDDNRAAVGFLGTTTGGDGNSDNAVCPPPGSGQVAFTGVWHMYIATTIDGGATWTTIDATPDSPVQVGPICRGGTLCPGYRNLLDFIGGDVDSQGRVLWAIAHGCPNCPNVGAACGSSNALSTIFRQSGGERLFSYFDSAPQANHLDKPANPQLVSATNVGNGVQLVWLAPDNGGSPITGYNIYRGSTSGGETFLTTVNNSPTNVQTKYLDTAATGPGPYFYHVTAVNQQGESGFCEELSPTAPISLGNACTFPYLEVNGPGTKPPTSVPNPVPGGTPIPTVANAQTIQSVNIGEPFVSCADNSLTFVFKVPSLDPSGTGQAVIPPNTEYQILFKVTDTNGNPETVYVEMDTNCPTGTSKTPEYGYGRRDTSATGGSFDNGQCTAGPTSTCPGITGNFAADGTITIKLDVSKPLAFAANTGSTTSTPFVWDATKPGTKLGGVNSEITLFAGCGAGLLETLSSSATNVNNGSTDYVRVGNGYCSTIVPVAVLTANPKSGPAPLAVTFDGSGSNEPNGACGTISEYKMDFGDGTVTAFQSSPSFAHTYQNPGNYAAKLTVSDTVGKTSTNVAQQVITVGSAGPPQLSAIFSRMTHGNNVGPRDVVLPTSGTRGVECRRPASAGTYQMVFRFANPVSAVQQATVTSGTATVSSSGISTTNPYEYLVNLSGVTNGQYVTVGLVNAQDSTGANGPEAGTMGVLIGDTTGDGTVNSADISQTKSQSGAPVTATSANFREDVTLDGNINSADISLVKSRSGTALPSKP